jgi:hypothetical protein
MRPKIALILMAVLALAWTGMAGTAGTAEKPATASPATASAAAASAAADPTLDRQKTIYFPATAPREYASAPWLRIWTDSDVDLPLLAGSLCVTHFFLEGECRSNRREYSATGPAARPVALAIYANADDFGQLWQRVGKYYGGSFGRVQAQAFSYHVFAASIYGNAKDFEARRPMLCHEFAHVWLYQELGLPNNANWLTEGLAAAVQLKFFPATGNRRDFATWLTEGKMLPLKRLMDQERIETKDYWQAATLVETILADYPGKLPAFIQGYVAGKSSYALVTGVLGTDLAALEAQWKRHVLATATAATQPAM